MMDTLPYFTLPPTATLPKPYEYPAPLVLPGEPGSLLSAYCAPLALSLSLSLSHTFSPSTLSSTINDNNHNQQFGFSTHIHGIHGLPLHWSWFHILTSTYHMQLYSILLPITSGPLGESGGATSLLPAGSLHTLLRALGFQLSLGCYCCCYCIPTSEGRPRSLRLRWSCFIPLGQRLYPVLSISILIRLTRLLQKRILDNFNISL